VTGSTNTAVAAAAAADATTLSARLASVSLDPDAGKQEAPLDTGTSRSCQETQTDIQTSQAPSTVDMAVQCSPVMADKHTAMTDCRTVCSIRCRSLCING